MPIAAGRLRERVTIQEPNLVDNGIGGRRAPAGEAKWRTVAERVPAEVIPLRGDEAVQHAVQRSSQLYRVSMRPRAGVTTAMRLIWLGRALDIKAAPPAFRDELVLTCVDGGTPA